MNSLDSTDTIDHTPDDTHTVDNPQSNSRRPSVARQVLAAIAFLAIVAAVATIGSLSTMQHTEGWYAEVQKVAWSPSNAIFAPVWSVLYVIIALVGFLVWKSGFVGDGNHNRARGTLWLYVVQLVLNFTWTPIFFSGYASVGAAAWWAALGVIVALVISVIWLIAATSRWSRAASWLLVPYLLWLIFASTLNAGVIALN